MSFDNGLKGDAGSKPIIEHVWSKDGTSEIFTAFYGYFTTFGVQAIHSSSADKAHKRLPHFRLYHRPQLENTLIAPCAAIVHHDLNDPTSDIDIDHLIDRYRECQVVFCLNKTQARQLNARGIKQTCVIAHGYHPDLLRVRERDRNCRVDPPWTLGLFSRRYPSLVKGEAFLYELARQLPPQKIRFLMMGKDRSKDVEFLSSLGFDVQARRAQSYQDYIQAYHEIDALLMMSVAEGGPASVPECLAAGVPLFTRNVGMVPDISQDIARDHIKDDNNMVLSLTDVPEVDAASILQFLTKGCHIKTAMEKCSPYIHPWSDVVENYEIEILKCLQNANDHSGGQ